MIPLYREPWYRFCFEDDRRIPRFHLEGIPAGVRVRVHRLEQDQPGPLLREGVVGPEGWVECQPPLRMRRGEGFLVIPCQ